MNTRNAFVSHWFRKPSPRAERWTSALPILVASALCWSGFAPAHAADATWAEIPTSGSGPAASGGTAIDDPVNHRKILFASPGCRFGPCPNAYVHSLDLNSGVWSNPVPEGPTPPDRAVPATIYDPLRTRMVAFGGGYGLTLNDVWELYIPPGGGMMWSEIQTQGAPSPRSLGAAVYDPVRDRMLLFGGDVSPNGFTTNEIWALDFSDATWHQLSPLGVPPSPRSRVAAVYDSQGDRMLVFGGHDGSAHLAETWELSLAGTPAWTQITAPGPPAAEVYRQVVVDPLRSRALMILPTGEVWALDLAGAPSWEQLSIDGWAPEYYSPIYDRDYDMVVVESNYYYPSTQHRSWALPFGAPGGPLGVTPLSRSRLSLEAPRPNPTRGDLIASFSLPSNEPARLDAYDVGGRRVLAREVGSLGTGTHRVNLTQGTRLPAGVYTLSLAQGDRRITTRAIVVR